MYYSLLRESNMHLHGCSAQFCLQLIVKRKPGFFYYHSNDIGIQTCVCECTRACLHIPEVP